MTTATAPKDTKETSRRIPAEYAMCRTWQHAWNYTTVERVGKTLVQGLVCLRCSTVRYAKIDSRTGERMGNRYDYPDKYVMQEGGTLTARERAALRLAEVRRHLRSS